MFPLERWVFCSLEFFFVQNNNILCSKELTISDSHYCQGNHASTWLVFWQNETSKLCTTIQDYCLTFFAVLQLLTQLEYVEFFHILFPFWGAQSFQVIERFPSSAVQTFTLACTSHTIKDDLAHGMYSLLYGPYELVNIFYGSTWSHNHHLLPWSTLLIILIRNNITSTLSCWLEYL